MTVMHCVCFILGLESLIRLLLWSVYPLFRMSIYILKIVIPF